ncbi:MAG: amidohydrolase/deacetylase family metallohydrolase [Anaerolineae bacterium]|nr:amidohydrolase/deacetylase family metallohydrolase [Anaerolineae bacterium]
MPFDLLLKGGEVIDPNAGYSGRLDIGITRNRITAVEPNIPPESAFQVIDVSGHYVAPGFIDLHTHYLPGTYWGLEPDAIGARTGVTTWVDAGSAGAMGLADFRDSAAALMQARSFAFVNISYIGLIGPNYEMTNPEYSNVELLKRAISQNRDIVAGVKIRAGRSGGGVDLTPFKRARRAADELGLRLMMHISGAPPELEEVLPFLKSGDVLTHAYNGRTMRLIEDNGKIREVAKRAVESGVLLDVGHGAGSFSFVSAEALIPQGYAPYTISSDLHWMALYGHRVQDSQVILSRGDAPDDDAGSVLVDIVGGREPAFDLLNCLTKMLHLGMSLPQIVEAVTAHPATVLGVEGEIGTLKPGAYADIAVFDVVAEGIDLYDVHGEHRHADRQFKHALTVLNGRVWEQQPLPKPPAWLRFVDEEAS